MTTRHRVTIVRACMRDGGGGSGGSGGTGGSPTAVVLEDGPPPGDEERRRVPAAWGTSHAVYVRRDGDVTDLRFFTSEGELPACGHGTIAALALLAPCRVTLRAGGRVFTGHAERRGGLVTAAFDPGPVALRGATEEERALVLPALGLGRADVGSDVSNIGSGTRDVGSGVGDIGSGVGDIGSDIRVAGVGRERLLVPVAGRAALAALTPDLDRLRAACDRLGLLGAYVHSPPDPEGRLAARMFAPSIGVPEDIANANSTACLAAHLAGRGIERIAVDMGDSLGSPATITATTGPGRAVRLGGTAEVLTDWKAGE
ncbi:PhzF family phenazine biosynthesis protein [Streptomyces sp. NPDC003943]